MDNDSRIDVSGSEDDFGNSVIAPRVGDQFQAQIPPLIIDCCCEKTDLENDYFIGLPVPITWASCNDENTKNEHKNGAHSPLPISPCRPWKAIEHESFLVGLYIFGKNLNNVKKFVKSKQMGEILRYYYGKFYMSSGYHRWSKGKKLKRKSCIRGEKIFAGWRRHELLSRLFLRASEESRGLLREINMKYTEDKVSLQKFVFALRRIVGIETLMEAISLGKGKRDLTRTKDPNLTRNLPPHIPKIPKGKKFSSLTPREVGQFLRKLQLSKPRLNDLFWEAVWPRLLANGWRSEQPTYYAIFSSKRSLVFILPGVGKFSKRGLKKGTHYFESVKEVLDRVASDPSLLTVKTDEEKANEQKANEENDTEVDVIQDPNNELAMLTIVDTSLRYGRERSKVVEKRTLPVETAYDISISSHSSSEAEEESSEDDIKERDTRDHSPELTNIEDNATQSVDGKSNEDESPRENSLDTYVNISSDGSLAEEEEEEDTGLSPIEGIESVDGESNGDESPRDKSLDTYEESQDAYDEDLDCNDQKSRALVDLNIPSTTQELKTKVKNTVHDQGDSDASTKVAPSQENNQCSDTQNGRRQSTRNRPLTTKALEAIAYGFLSPNRKRKNIEKNNDYMSSRPPRMARDKRAKCSGSSDSDNNAD